MRVAVFGLGYVGVVSAACLAARGHEVIGVDVNADKVQMVNRGESPVYEPRIGELVADGITSGRLRATTSGSEAVDATDLAFVCVGTPSSRSGGLSTTYLERVANDIGGALPHDRRYIVAFRSTMLPGTCEGHLVPILEKASGLARDKGFGVCVHPEFLREGTSVSDFYDPPKTVIGSSDPEVAAQVSSLYTGLPGPTFHTPIRVAEMTKYVDNSFHALKVAFANEVGAICKESGVDSHEVMEIFKADTKLNISPAYLTPGFAFGGSCLPKDVRALVHHARHLDVSVPVLEHLMPSNEDHLERAFQLVLASGCRRVGILGLAFKQGTDDLRESPMVHLAELLIGRGFDLKVYDANVATSHLLGANRAYVESRLPHLSALLHDSVDVVVEHAETLVIGSRAPAVVEALKVVDDRTVIDLIRVPAPALESGYHGIAW